MAFTVSIYSSDPQPDRNVFSAVVEHPQEMRLKYQYLRIPSVGSILGWICPAVAPMRRSVCGGTIVVVRYLHHTGLSAPSTKGYDRLQLGLNRIYHDTHTWWLPWNPSFRPGCLARSAHTVQDQPGNSRRIGGSLSFQHKAPITLASFDDLKLPGNMKVTCNGSLKS